MSSVQPSTTTNSMILNGNDTSTGDSIIMPIDIKHAGDHQIDHQEGNEDHEADLKRGLQLAGDESRNQHRQRHIIGAGKLRLAGELGKQLQIIFAGLRQHEFLERLQSCARLPLRPASWPSRYGLMPAA